MTLTIVSVAYPFAPVDADPAGGSEQVLAAIDRALVAAGHRSIVIAAAGSRPVGAFRAVPAPNGPIEGDQWERAHAAIRAHLAEVIADERPDLVHLHGFDFGSYVPAPGLPVLVTLHLPLAWYTPAWLRPTRPRTWLQPVSADQAARAEPGVPLLDPVPNGVDLDRYRPAPKRDHLLVIGRVAPEKGFHDAIDAARIAGVPLIAAGQVFAYAEHEQYFAEEVAPRLDAERRFIGPVAGAEKAALLAGARAVLIPSTAAETSSLVAMEALASGTPVIAYRSGALPGIVEDGVTGFLVDDVVGMADAIARIDAIDPAACRRAAEARFGLNDTLARYLALYERLSR